MGKGLKKLIRENIDPSLRIVLHRNKATEKFINAFYKAINKYGVSPYISFIQRKKIQGKRIIYLLKLNPLFYDLFCFSETDEGFDFWFDLNNQLKEERYGSR